MLLKTNTIEKQGTSLIMVHNTAAAVHLGAFCNNQKLIRMIARSHSGFMLRYNVFISKMHLERRFAQKKNCIQPFCDARMVFWIPFYDTNGGGGKKVIPVAK